MKKKTFLKLSLLLSVSCFLFFLIFPQHCLAGTWTSAGANTYYTGGNVGIGTTSPALLFDVHGGRVGFYGLGKERLTINPNYTNLTYIYEYNDGTTKSGTVGIGGMIVGASTIQNYSLFASSGLVMINQNNSALTTALNVNGGIVASNYTDTWYGYTPDQLRSSSSSSGSATATSSIDRGWTAPQESDIMTMHAIIVTILECWALGFPVLIVIAFLWLHLKKIWTA